MGSLTAERRVRPCLATRILFRNGAILLSSYGKGFPEEDGLLLNWTGTTAVELSVNGASAAEVAEWICAAASAPQALVTQEVLAFFERLLALGLYETCLPDGAPSE